MKLPALITDTATPARPPVVRTPSSPTKLSASVQPRKTLLTRSSTTQDTPPLIRSNGTTSPVKMQPAASALTKRTSSPLSLPPVQFSPLPSSPKLPLTPSPQSTPAPAVSIQWSPPIFSNFPSFYPEMTPNFKNYVPKFVSLKRDAQTTRNEFVN